MQYFPLFVDTQSLKVVIVGAGDVASRKLDLLCRTEAVITVVAPEVSDEVLAYAKQGRIALEQRPVEAQDIEGISLLYMATADEQLNQHYAEVASSKGVWVNVVDSPELCRFITPSIVDRGRLIVAISTAGAAPVFARDLRAKLESLLSPSIAPLFDFIASKRAEVQSRLPVFKQRKLFWERFFTVNGEQFDTQTSALYEQCFSELDAAGELLLLDEQADAQLLPIAILPVLQKIDAVYSTQALKPSLLELLRRDAQRCKYQSIDELTPLLDTGEKILVVAPNATLTNLKTAYQQAKQIQVGHIA